MKMSSDQETDSDTFSILPLSRERAISYVHDQEEEAARKSNMYYERSKWWGRMNYIIQGISILIGTVGAMAGVADFESEQVARLIASFASILVAGLAATSMKMNAGKKDERYEHAGDQYRLLKDQLYLVDAESLNEENLTQVIKKVHQKVKYLTLKYKE